MKISIESSITRYRNRHKVKGLCQDCSKLALVCRSRCEIHNERNNHYTREACRKTYVQRKAEGRCPKCGVPLVEGEGVICVNCIILKKLSAQGRIK